MRVNLPASRLPCRDQQGVYATWCVCTALHPITLFLRPPERQDSSLVQPRQASDVRSGVVVKERLFVSPLPHMAINFSDMLGR